MDRGVWFVTGRWCEDEICDGGMMRRSVQVSEQRVMQKLGIKVSNGKWQF